MYNVEMCEKDFKKLRVKYYKKYFLNKTLNSAIYDAFQDNLKLFAGVYLRYLLLYECMKIIIESDDFKTLYDKETSEHAKAVLEGVENLYKDLENILSPLCRSLAI